MNKLCLFGAKGHGKVLLDIAQILNYNEVVFCDDFPAENTIKGIKVFSSNLIEDFLDYSFVISIGNNKTRKKIVEKFQNLTFTKLIHPSAIISPDVDILLGSVVMPNAVVNSSANIGNHVIINTGAIVEHDCIISDYAHISPNATLTGNVEVGEGSHIGAGAVIIPNIKIGKWCTIGAGTVVVKDIPDNTVVVGNPGRVIKHKSN